MQTSNPPLITSACGECGQPFEWEQLYFPDGRAFHLSQGICDPCSESHQQRDPDSETSTRRASFRATLPKAFRDTDRTRLPRSLVQAVEDYRFSSIGLGFVGASGAGKTRVMLLLLERLAASGKSCEWITSTDLAYLSADQFSDHPQDKHQAKETLRRLRRSQVMFIDDLGKSRMTDRVETELFDILDCRTREGLPTFWTSNSGGQDLLAMLSADRGEALLRRIGKEFSTIVRV